MSKQNTLKLELPLPVSLNQLYINQTFWDAKKKRYVPTGKRILSQKGKKAKMDIQKQAKKQMKGQKWNYELTKSTYLYQDMVVYFNRLGRDSDNLLKCLNDSLEGLVFVNDTKLLTRTQKVMIDTKNPHIVVEFSFVEFEGIFDSKKEAKAFEKRCTGCSFYRNGRCSILQDSLEGRVREEINDVESKRECMKYKEKASQ